MSTKTLKSIAQGIRLEYRGTSRVSKFVVVWFLIFAYLLLASAFSQVTPLENGRLDGPLNGNGEEITGLNQLQFGSGSLGTGRIQLLPNGSPTTNADGIQFGSDGFIFRSGAGTITVTGNLVVSGLLTAGSGVPSLAGNNTWTGSQSFNLAPAFTAGASVGSGGLTFSGTGAADTRTNLSLVPGANVQAYSLRLTEIAGITPASNLFIMGNSTSWTGVTGAPARTALGLGNSATLDIGTTAGTVAAGDDSRLTDSREPTGAAGGDLAGTYPNPTLGTSGVTAGSYGTGTQVPVISFDAKGRATSATTTAITGAPPTGAAGGDLTGTYPNPTLGTSGVISGTYGSGNQIPQITVDAKGRVTSVTSVPQVIVLGNGTTGNYVQSVAAGTGVTVTGTGAAADVTVSVGQAVGPTASPSFQGVTVNGTISGVLSGKVVVVSASASGATDTRTGVSKYDANRPFVSVAAAMAAAASGDIIRIDPATSGYGAVSSVNKTLVFEISPGASVSGITVTGAVTVGVQGAGVLGDGTATAVTVSNSSAIVNINSRLLGDTEALNVSSGTVNLRATAEALNTGGSVITMGATGVLNLLPGSGMACNAGATTSITGTSGAVVNVYSVVPSSGAITGVTPTVVSGFVAGDRVSFGTASFTGATSAGNAVFLGSDVSFWRSGTNAMTLNGTLNLLTPLPVASGGTGATSAANARTALGLGIGTNVQAFNQGLTDIAGISPVANTFITGNGTKWVSSNATGLTDIAGISPAANTFITGNGTKWVSSNATAVLGMLGIGGATEVQSLSASGDILNTSAVVRAEQSASTTMTLTLPQLSEVPDGSRVIVVQVTGLTTGTTTVQPFSGDTFTTDAPENAVLRKSGEAVVFRKSEYGGYWVVESGYYPGVRLERMQTFSTSPTNVVLDTSDIVYLTNTTQAISATLPALGSMTNGQRITFVQSPGITTGRVSIEPSDNQFMVSETPLISDAPGEITVVQADTLNSRWLVVSRYRGGTIRNSVIVETTRQKGAAAGIINVDAARDPVSYYQTNATNNFTINVRGDSAINLSQFLEKRADTAAGLGDTITVVVIVKSGATGRTLNSIPGGFTIDSHPITPIWVGGAIPTATANVTTVYSFTIIKTGETNSYLVLGSFQVFS
jgi:hypothetical protein